MTSRDTMPHSKRMLRPDVCKHPGPTHVPVCSEGTCDAALQMAASMESRGAWQG